MAKQTIGIGTTANDGTGDPARTAFGKVNDNFDELYGTYVTADSTGSATDNTAAIQEKLDAGGVVRVGAQGIVYTNATLVIGDDTTLIVDAGCTLKAVSGMNDAMLVTEAHERADVTVSGITSSGNTCTATTSTDHGLVVGDYVAISWANPEGYSGVFEVITTPLSTTFTYFAPLTLSATSATAGSGSTIKARKATVRPTVIANGTIDYNGANSTGVDGTGLMNVVLTHSFKPTISGRFIGADKYNVWVACATDVVARDLVMAGASDGIHLTGPIFGADISNVQGNNDDNLVAAGTSDYSTYAISEGPLIGVRIRNVRGEGNEISPIRVFGSSTWGIDAEVDGVHSANGAVVPLVQVLQDTSVVPNGKTYIRRLVIKNVSGYTGNTGKIILLPWKAEYVEIDGLTMENSAGSNMNGITIGNGTNTVGTITGVDTGTNVLTDVAHGLATDDRITVWSTGAMPTGLTQGQVYFVKKSDNDTFTLALTAGGSDIDITGAGSGTITWRYVYCDFEKIIVRAVTHYPVDTATASGAVYVGESANIMTMDVTNVSVSHLATIGVLSMAGTVQVLNVRDCYLKSTTSGKLVNIETNAVYCPMRVNISGLRISKSSWCVNNNAAINIDVFSYGSIYETASQPFRHAGATGRLRVYSAANDYQFLTNALVKTSSATLEAYGWDIPMDVDNLATTAEQFCRNTDATSTAGIAAGICRYRAGWALV